MATAALRPLLQSAATTLTVGATAWITYDYRTCHPMREMQGYDVKGAWIRFHNTFRPAMTLSTMTLEDLSKYDGSVGNSNSKSNSNTAVYFASEGWVWDVSQSQVFQDAYGNFKGKDASVALAKMSMTPQDVNSTDWESLTDSEWKSLQSWTDYFQQKYLIRGKVCDFPRRS
mmetsp:Transcript_27198/g.41813  ORF Transcript_27198/g.41813 Transcript_27198/m.41813 type:complete len:172 (-) Transcript_27198:86-601(-)